MALAIESPQRHKRGKSRYLPLEAFVLLACFTIASILFITISLHRGKIGVLLRNQISVSLLIDSEIASESTETFGTKSSDVRHVADLSEEFVDDISVPFYIYPGMEAISYHIVQVLLVILSIMTMSDVYHSNGQSTKKMIPLIILSFIIWTWINDLTFI